MDMEWNQAMSSKSSVFNHLPIHLRGEIIQIGAVRLNDDWTPGEEFQIDVKPVYFRKMHYKVKKLTGIGTERLSAWLQGGARQIPRFLRRRLHLPHLGLRRQGYHGAEHHHP